MELNFVEMFVGWFPTKLVVFVTIKYPAQKHEVKNAKKVFSIFLCFVQFVCFFFYQILMGFFLLYNSLYAVVQQILYGSHCLRYKGTKIWNFYLQSIFDKSFFLYIFNCLLYNFIGRCSYSKLRVSV